MDKQRRLRAPQTYAAPETSFFLKFDQLVAFVGGGSAASVDLSQPVRLPLRRPHRTFQRRLSLPPYRPYLARLRLYLLLQPFDDVSNRMLVVMLAVTRSRAEQLRMGIGYGNADTGAAQHLQIV